MADLSDVEQALVSQIDSIMYPSGDGGAVAGGFPVRIYRGWPTPEQLDPDLAAGVSHVSVFSQAGYSRVVPGYLTSTAATVVPPTVTLTVSGNIVTVGGTPGAGQLIGVLVNGSTFSYALTNADTPTSAAAALAALAGANVTSVVGPAITLNTALTVLARTAGVGTSYALPRTQVQGIRVSIWATTPAARDTIASTVDAALSAVTFLALADGTAGRVKWLGSNVDDYPQRQQMWGRSIIYSVQYSTSLVQQVAAGLWVGLSGAILTTSGVTVGSIPFGASAGSIGTPLMGTTDQAVPVTTDLGQQAAIP